MARRTRMPASKRADASRGVSSSDMLEPHVVLGQARRRCRRAAHVAQLRKLKPLLKRVVSGKSEQHRGHPPGKVFGAPHSAQTRCGVIDESTFITRAIPARECFAEHARVGYREVHPLRTRRRYHVRGIPHEK